MHFRLPLQPAHHSSLGCLLPLQVLLVLEGGWFVAWFTGGGPGAAFADVSCSATVGGGGSGSVFAAVLAVDVSSATIGGGSWFP